MTRLATIVFFLLCVASCFVCNAQKAWSVEKVLKSAGGRLVLYEGIYREPVPEAMSMNLRDAVTVDESRIVVKYDVDVRLDTLTTKCAKDQVLTMIGPKMSLSLGLWNWRECVSSAAYYSNKSAEKEYYESLKSELGKRPSGYTEMIGWFVYRDLNARTVLNKHMLPMRRNTIEYTEPLPKMNWSMSDDTKEILGYGCQKAETDFRGRHWTVWFTPEVPVDCGLWKFSGLPGLIVEAISSDGFYHYTAVSVENKSMKIQKYPKAVTKRLSREQFRKTESAIYANPIIGNIFYEESGQDYWIGAHTSAYDGPKETDRYVFKANNYVSLYFPMELE